MAKQTGTYRIKGAHQGICYYRVKGGIGDVLRTINPAMSKRVKEDPEFLNLRKWQEEFKTYTSAAHSIYACTGEALDSDVIHVYKPRTLANLTKLMRQYLQDGATAPIGERDFRDNGWQRAATNFLNSQCKVDGSAYGDMINSAKLKRNPTTPLRNSAIELNYSLNGDAGKEYLRRGFDKVQIQFEYRYDVGQIYDPERGIHHGGYHAGFSIGSPIIQTIGESGTATTITKLFNSFIPLPDGSRYFHRLVIRVTPFKSRFPDVLYYAHQSICIVPFETTE